MPATASEMWKPIPGFSGYEASSLGRIRSYWRCAKGKGRGAKEICDTPKIMKQICVKSGHMQITIGQGDARRVIKVHVLILLAFAGPKPFGKICCHNDGNPQNNSAENLRWDTYKSNSRDTIAHGRHDPRRGERQRGSKLTAELVIQIRSTEGVVSQAEWASRLGVSRATIYAVRSFKKWAHV